MPVPATFWRRYAAYSLDLAIVGVVAVPLLAWSLRDVPAAFDAAIAALQLRLWELFDAALGDLAGPFEFARRWADDPALRAGIEALLDVVFEALAVATLVIVGIAAAWFVGFESSARQATPGKAALGLRVTGADGERAPTGRILARFIAGAPSWALLHFGHAMAGFTKDRRALHDLIAGTRVEQAEPADTPLPAWAKAWLAAQVLGFVALVAYVVLRYAMLLGEVAAGGF